VKKLTDEERAQRRAAKLQYYKDYSKRRMADPEYKARRQAQIREYFKQPENKDKIKVWRKAQWQRSKESGKYQEYMGRPEVKVKTRKTCNAHKSKKYASPTGRILYLATQAIYRARKRGIEYDKLALTELSHIPPTSCQCCSKPFLYAEYGKAKLNDVPSIDRVDNTKGYIRGNIAVICNQCNKAKRDSTIQQLLNVVKYVQRHT
jgi:hypothetical protein